MSVILLAAAGVAIVLSLILIFRLHPLLSLLLGSLFLLAVTPRELVLESRLAGRTYVVQAVTSNGLLGFGEVVPQIALMEWPAGQLATGVDPMDPLRLSRATVNQLQQAQQDSELDAGLVWYAAPSSSPSLAKGTRLVGQADWDDAYRQLGAGLGGRLADGFARTFQKLGIPVTMAAIVGVCLLQSGAATRLVAAIVSLFGPGGTAPALTASGFILGIPVFFDNVFYLLLPLAKAVGRAHPEKFLTAVMAIIVGATMAHSLVPPTPGPLFVAEQMGVSVGMMMIAGIIVGGVAAIFGFWYGKLCGRWVSLNPDSVHEGEVVARENARSIPLWFAAMPIALPIALLGGSEIIQFLATESPDDSIIARLNRWVAVVNDPSLIFIGAALVGLLLLRRYSDRDTVAKAVARGLSDAGIIVLLTCAGGAFGASLQQLDLAGAIGAQFAGLTQPWGLLWTAFILTAVIRVAQGSATVAMLTSSSIIAPVMQTVELPFHPIYMALAIGCGSKPLPWMNDSGFWQVTTMTGMTPSQTFRSFSIALTIMGIVGFSMTLLGAWLLPLKGTI